MKFLSDDKRGEDQYVDRGGVLEKYGVGGGRVLGCPNEQEKQGRVNYRSHDAERVYPQTVFSRNDENRNSRQQRAKKSYLIGVERRELDKKAAGAP